MPITNLNGNLLTHLDDVHVDLQRLFCYMACMHKDRFRTTAGLRTTRQQRKLVEAGASRTMRSKHLSGRAVDVALHDENGGVSWEFERYAEFAQDVYEAADHLGISIFWGGEWPTLRDGPHFELK